MSDVTIFPCLVEFCGKIAIFTKLLKTITQYQNHIYAVHSNFFVEAFLFYSPTFFFQVGNKIREHLGQF